MSSTLQIMQAKISTLQTQVAMLSLTIASLQTNIKDLDKQMQQMQIQFPANDDSDGYELDEQFLPNNPYVLIQWDNDLEEI